MNKLRYRTLGVIELKYNWRCYAGGIVISSRKLLLYKLWKNYNYCKKHSAYWNKYDRI